MQPLSVGKSSCPTVLLPPGLMLRIRTSQPTFLAAELAPAPAASHKMPHHVASSQVQKKDEGASAICGGEWAGFVLFAHTWLLGGH